MNETPNHLRQQPSPFPFCAVAGDSLLAEDDKVPGHSATLLYFPSLNTDDVLYGHVTRAARRCGLDRRIEDVAFRSTGAALKGLLVPCPSSSWRALWTRCWRDGGQLVQVVVEVVGGITEDPEAIRGHPATLH